MNGFLQLRKFWFTPALFGSPLSLSCCQPYWALFSSDANCSILLYTSGTFYIVEMSSSSDIYFNTDLNSSIKHVLIPSYNCSIIDITNVVKSNIITISNTDFALKSDSLNLCVKDFTPYAT